MRPDERDAAYLWDMLRHAKIVVELVAGFTQENYAIDRRLQLAVERAIEIVGEAARNVSPAYQLAHPNVPWKAIVAQRHVLAHEYGEINHEKIWRVATVHVPALIPQLERLIPNVDE